MRKKTGKTVDPLPELLEAAYRALLEHLIRQPFSTHVVEEKVADVLRQMAAALTILEAVIERIAPRQAALYSQCRSMLHIVGNGESRYLAFPSTPQSIIDEVLSSWS